VRVYMFRQICLKPNSLLGEGTIFALYPNFILQSSQHLDTKMSGKKIISNYHENKLSDFSKDQNLSATSWNFQLEEEARRTFAVSVLNKTQLQIHFSTLVQH